MVRRRARACPARVATRLSVRARESSPSRRIHPNQGRVIAGQAARNLGRRLGRCSRGTETPPCAHSWPSRSPCSDRGVLEGGRQQDQSTDLKAARDRDQERLAVREAAGLRHQGRPPATPARRSRRAPKRPAVEPGQGRATVPRTSCHEAGDQGRKDAGEKAKVKGRTTSADHQFADHGDKAGTQGCSYASPRRIEGRLCAMGGGVRPSPPLPSNPVLCLGPGFRRG